MAATQAQPTTQAIEKSNAGKIMATLNDQKFVNQLSRALTRKYVTPDKMVRVALTVIKGDFKLQKCDPLSIAGSLIQLAQIELTPDGFLGQAYLVPFWNGQRKCYEAKPMIGYRGYTELAYRSDKVSKVTAQVVYEGDECDIDLVNNHVSHKPWMRPTPENQKRGNIIGAYAVVQLKNGEKLIEWMTKEDTDAIRERSKSAKDKDGKPTGPWLTDYAEMARKSPMRRIAKWTPSPDMQTAAAMEEAVELGETRTTLDQTTGEIVFSQVTEEEHEPLQRPAVEGKKTETVQAESQPQATTNSGQPTGGELFDNKTEQAQAEQESAVEGCISVKQIKRLFAITRGAGHDEGWLHEFLKQRYGLESVKHVKVEKYDAICEEIGKDLAIKQQPKK